MTQHTDIRISANSPSHNRSKFLLSYSSNLWNTARLRIRTNLDFHISSPVSAIVCQFQAHLQQYSDDTRLFLFLSPAILSSSLSSLKACLFSLPSWFLHDDLALNRDLTEAFCVASSNWHKSLFQLSSHQVPNSTVHLSNHTKFQGCPHLSICPMSTANLEHIRSLHWIRPFLDLEISTSATLVNGSRLDYANSLLCGIPAYNIQRLQRVKIHWVASSQLKASEASLHQHILLHHSTGYLISKESRSSSASWYTVLFISLPILSLMPHPLIHHLDFSDHLIAISSVKNLLPHKVSELQALVCGMLSFMTSNALATILPLNHI